MHELPNAELPKSGVESEASAAREEKIRERVSFYIDSLSWGGAQAMSQPSNRRNYRALLQEIESWADGVPIPADIRDLYEGLTPEDIREIASRIRARLDEYHRPPAEEL